MRAANAAAGQFAAQAVTFTAPAADAALARRRIRAGELLFLAGDLSGSLEQLQVLDADALPTADLERALPLLADGTDFASGPAAATALITRALDATGTDDRRRALLLSLASDVAYGIRGGRRAAAVEAIRCAEAACPAANLSLHRALVNLVVAKITAGEGLDAALLERAEELERVVPRIPLHDTADLHRGLWSFASRTSIPHGRRCCAASPAPGRRPKISGCRPAWATWRRPRNWLAITRPPRRPWRRSTRSPPGTTGRYRRGCWNPAGSC